MQKTMLALLFASALPAIAATDHAQPALWKTVATLQQHNWVDLTHAFDEHSSHWKGFKPLKREIIYDYAKDGFRVELTTHVGQWGTHLDAPNHFHAGKRAVDQIPLKEFLLPLVVLDIHRQVAVNPDYTVSLQDVQQWEKKHGAIPAGAFVALRTDWSQRWPDQDKIQNLDANGVAHYPGWSLPVLKYLYETRHITASGHETTDTDPGLATSKDDYSLESYILAGNHYQIELLTHLDQVPEAGALISVTTPKFRDAVGFPARVFAILP